MVAVDAGALKELCQDGINGVLCDQDDDEQMARGITSIIIDSKLRKKYAEASLAIADTHDINHTLDEFLTIYDQVMQ